jgi:hypothetical protein
MQYLLKTIPDSRTQEKASFVQAYQDDSFICIAILGRVIQPKSAAMSANKKPVTHCAQRVFSL